MQKRAIRTMIGCGHRESCKKLFVELKILPLASQYIFSLLLFVVNNRNYFTPNSAFYDSNTRERIFSSQQLDRRVSIRIVMIMGLD